MGLCIFSNPHLVIRIGGSNFIQFHWRPPGQEGTTPEAFIRSQLPH